MSSINDQIHELDNDYLINTSMKQNENRDEQEYIDNSNKSKEKILHLTRGKVIWRKIGCLFGISITILIISLIISIVSKFFYLLILTGLAGLGIFFCIIFVCCCSSGFITIQPNEAVVYHYYGRYLGTVKENGYFYGYPLAKTFRISMRSNQYNGSRLKVNERDGNPVELGIIVVWKIGDTAKAVLML